MPLLLIGAPIFVGFAALAALVCWLLIYGRGHWAVKASTTLAVLAFSFAVWHSFNTYGGWPISTTPPAHAYFVAGMVIEPNTSAGESGRIYLWLVPRDRQHSLFGYSSQESEPRAYQIPYSDQANAAVQAAQQEQGHGTPVAFDRVKRPSHGQSSGPHVKYHAYRLPPSAPTRKGTP